MGTSRLPRWFLPMIRATVELLDKPKIKVSIQATETAQTTTMKKANMYLF